jgi:hypothetical protein
MSCVADPKANVLPEILISDAGTKMNYEETK